MTAALWLLQSLSDDDDFKIGLIATLIVIGVPIALLICWRVYIRAGQKKKYEKARRAAHDFRPPNVHGSAGVAPKDDARRKGWLK